MGRDMCTFDDKEFQLAFVTDAEGVIIDKVMVPIEAAYHTDFIESNVSNTAPYPTEQTNEEQRITEDSELSDYIYELKQRIALSQTHIDRIRSVIGEPNHGHTESKRADEERMKTTNDNPKAEDSRNRDNSHEYDEWTQPRQHGIWDYAIREVDGGYSDLIEAFGQVYVREPITLITKNEILPSSPIEGRRYRRSR